MGKKNKVKEDARLEIGFACQKDGIIARIDINEGRLTKRGALLYALIPIADTIYEFSKDCDCHYCSGCRRVAEGVKALVERESQGQHAGMN